MVITSQATSMGMTSQASAIVMTSQASVMVMRSQATSMVMTSQASAIVRLLGSHGLTVAWATAKECWGRVTVRPPAWTLLTAIIVRRHPENCMHFHDMSLHLA